MGMRTRQICTSSYPIEKVEDSSYSYLYPVKMFIDIHTIKKLNGNRKSLVKNRIISYKSKKKKKKTHDLNFFCLRILTRNYNLSFFNILIYFGLKKLILLIQLC